MSNLIPLSQMPLRPRHWYILLVASMEQIIGAALSTIAGIIIPLILLLGSPHLSASEQGLLGASALLGIAVGSMIIGKLMDSTGYLVWFRLCPIVIMIGAIAVYFSVSALTLFLSLFCIGLGVGGGYSLDSGYISEIMPTRWEGFFVGLAKAVCSLGFIGGALVSYIIIAVDPQADAWPRMIIFIGVLGLITLLMRIHWYQSPGWLMSRGRAAQAQKAARDFMGPNAEVAPQPKASGGSQKAWIGMFEGESLKKVILSGLTWACEGLGVYGFGVFLPILVMALGLQAGEAEGIAKVAQSVKTTIFINLFIAAGFAIGLAIIHKVNLVRLMGWGFILCALSLAGLLLAHNLGWATWISFLFFVIFETALNAGPHLVTFIIPSKIYSIDERGAGTGIATMLGKIGAVAGVFFMPLILHWGGIAAVLLVSLLVQGIGAAISFIYGKSLKLC